ncbi:MAG: ATP-dependent RecD-like DNA helicase [Lachnospiraceae bacterium]|nr:ATP-dependent RecD-like DNA helicase [Lachnospiraceae bacterium]
METIEGYVEHIVYRNEDNGYTVMNMVSEGEEITCVGILPFVSEGELVEAGGRYTEHSTYGEQFQIETYEIKAPEDALAMERYLGSGAIKGVGGALAARIVRRFREDTFRIIEMEPERLSEIKGISEKKAREIAQQVEEKKDMREAMIFLQKYGISTALSVKIYQKYGAGIYSVMQENPYRMADDIAGVGFRIADEIARKAGIHTDSDFRIKSGIFYTLQQASADGHIYLPRKNLLQQTTELLGVNLDSLDQHLMDMAVDKKIAIKEEEGEVRVYASSYYYLELNTAKMLHDLNIHGEIDEEKVLKKIQGIEKENDTVLDEKQRQAIIETVRCGVTVITGGPGTGKTTTINTIISYFETEGLEIALAAPTGRAAKRMTEATGYEARTIHRLLEVAGGPDGGSGGFGRNAQNPLEADVIIVDEMSMVDIHLFYALLSAIPVGTRLVLVGDVNQLPSVGPGCVLKDIIESDQCQTVCLTRIFRQATTSDIVVNAHKINRGEHMVLDNKSSDFFFLKRNDANVIISIVIQLVREKMPKYVNAEQSEIQVLTPMKKGLLGVERLNRILQEYLNPTDGRKKEHSRGETLFREGDKVMQIKNNYQIEWEVRGRHGMPVDRGTGVFNGDMGIIREINEYTEKVEVEFDEQRRVQYPFTGLEELELAYAVTIHKSQGSEYPAVVIPLLSGPRMLMNRNLLYTAVTRAKSCVTLVGDPETFYQMIDNTMEQKRYSSLALRIKELG